jgi:hypothetical protein
MTSTARPGIKDGVNDRNEPLNPFLDLRRTDEVEAQGQHCLQRVADQRP